MAVDDGFTLTDLQKLLVGSTSDKLFIIKFGASWCGPCKRIKAVAEGRMDALVRGYCGKAVCVNIDIDEHLDLYGQLKRHRIVRGIPAVLAYRGTDCQDPWYQPLDSVSGGDITNIEAFFARCEARLQ